MEEDMEKSSIVRAQQPNHLAKLVCKLRWLGMEDEAQRLQLAMRHLPPEQRAIVCVEPSSTD
jgi:hypothetical protein